MSALLCHRLVGTRMNQATLENSLVLLQACFIAALHGESPFAAVIGFTECFIEHVLKNGHRAARKTFPCLLPTWSGSPPGRYQQQFHLLAVARPVYPAKGTVRVGISKSHALVTHQKPPFSLGPVLVTSQCASQYILCPFPCRDDSCGGTSHFPVSDGSNWIILMPLNAKFFETCFCFVCSRLNEKADAVVFLEFNFSC